MRDWGKACWSLYRLVLFEVGWYFKINWIRRSRVIVGRHRWYAIYLHVPTRRQRKVFYDGTQVQCIELPDADPGEED